MYTYTHTYICGSLNNFSDFFVQAFKIVQGSLNKFPDFFRMGAFIDSTHMKL